MATTAIQPNIPKSSSGSPTSALLLSSVVGASFILGGVVLAGLGVPMLFKGINLGNSFINAFVRILLQVAVVGALAFVGGKLAGANPVKGLRGGIFLVISLVMTFFFLVRAVGLNFGDLPAAVVGALILLGGIRLLTSTRGMNWMYALEEQGWFHTNSYKRTQGRRMRQYTMIGLLLIGMTGIWSLMNHNVLGSGDLTYRLPFGLPNLTLLTDEQFSVPLLLALALLWVTWRTINIPTFADFLIATEAEMNKVSWSSRKRLIQDTIVVLITTLLLTLFLLVIDLFWGWALADLLGILPKADPSKIQKPDVTGQSRPW